MNIPTPAQLEQLGRRAAATEWELIDTTGKRRARGTFAHCEAEFLELANSEFQNQTMTNGFTLRRVPTKTRKRPAKRNAPHQIKVGATV